MDRIDELLAAMTVDEKIGQLVMASGAQAVTGPIAGGDVMDAVRAGRVGSLLNIWGAAEVRAVQKAAIEESRLGVPLVFGFDVLHGHKTIFPVPLGEAAAFDPPLWKATAAAAALEAAADGLSMVFAPMLDVTRDPRWGRIVEGAGEDPFVTGEFGRAKIAGFQGMTLGGQSPVAVVAKHFCAYGAPAAGRDYASVDVSARALSEVYLPPFAAALKAGCAALMPAFMDLNGVPMTANRALLQEELRRERRFEGIIVSDYNAIAELLRHGVAACLMEAAALALKAGIDVDMMSGAYREGLPRALALGRVGMDEIDAAVRRVLRFKQRLGLFEDPFRARAATAAVAPDAKALAREAGRRAIVLLENDGVLPLAAATGKIALIGPLADAPSEMDGPWAAASLRRSVSIRAGLAAALPLVQIACAAGEGEGDELDAALALCRDADVILLCLGETAAMSGEAASRADLGLPGRQRELAEAALAFGKPVVVVLTSGRPLTLAWLFGRASAVLATWFLGAEAGHAVADVLTGRFNPVGRLPVTWPRAVGQIPIHYAARPGGRPFDPADSYTSKYLDCPNTPQFHFGHGLSYCRFRLGDFAAAHMIFALGDTLEFSVEIFNDGPAAGEATVFLFARDVVACVARPLLELKRFGKIALAAGEKGIVRFSLPASELAFPGLDLEPVFEPGAFAFSVGFSANPEGLATIRLEAVASTE